MPSIEYKTIYTADDSKAIASIDRQIAKLKQLDQALDATKKKLADLGANMPGVATAMSSLSNLGRALGAIDPLSDKAYDALRRVGNDTGGMTRAGNKAAQLTVALKEVEVQAPKTAAALQRVGGGMPGTGGSGGAGGGTGSATATAVRATIGTLVHRAVNSTVGVYADSQQQERDFQNDVAARAYAFREERRELAGLMGFPEPGATVARSSLGLMRGAGMSAAEEAEFSTEYFNSAAIGKDKGNLGAAGPDRDKLEQEIRLVGAQFAVRAGIAPGTAGDLAGAVGTYKKIGSVADVAGELAGVHYGLDQGRGRMTALMKSELSQAGSKVSGGQAADLPELAAMIGVLSGSAKSGGSAGTSYGQMSRLLNEASGPDAEFLKKIGVSDVKGDLAKLHKLNDYFRQNNVSDVNQHLAENGFGNQTDRNQIQFAISQLGVIDQRVAEARRRTQDPSAFLAKNAEFRASTQGQSRATRAEAEAAQVERGIGVEPLAQLRTAGRAHRLGPDHVMPQAGTFGGGFTAGLLGLFGAGDGEQELDDLEGIRLLAERFKKAGHNLKSEFPELVKQTGGMYNPFTGEGRQSGTNDLRQREVSRATAAVEQYEKAAREQQQGAADLKQAAAALNNAAAALAQGGNGAPLPPAPLPGKPAVAPKRP